MKLAIMQPYFFPYIGYFQLIYAADKFIIYDDVAYKRKGWINRNRILEKGKPSYFTLQTVGASQNKLINQVKVGENNLKLLKTTKHNYSKAPFFASVMPLIETILGNEEKNLAIFIANSLKVICRYLMIDTEILYSSQIEKDISIRRENKIIEICRKVNCDIYINLIGGQMLYFTEHFRKNGIELVFLKSNTITYSQFNNEFVPFLSIIDIMMFNSIAEIHKMLSAFELVYD